MKNKTEKARELFLEGYNCSQAVLGAFCEDLGLPFETALKISSSFGGGMGRMREVCGALSGAFMVAGLSLGYANPTDKDAKAEHYRLIQAMAEEFKKENGSIICRELLGLSNSEKQSHIPDSRTAEYYKKRPCVQLVEIAAEIAEKALNGEL